MILCFVFDFIVSVLFGLLCWIVIYFEFISNHFDHLMGQKTRFALFSRLFSSSMLDEILIKYFKWTLIYLNSSCEGDSTLIMSFSLRSHLKAANTIQTIFVKKYCKLTISWFRKQTNNGRKISSHWEVFKSLLICRVETRKRKQNTQIDHFQWFGFVASLCIDVNGESERCMDSTLTSHTRAVLFPNY